MKINNYNEFFIQEGDSIAFVKFEDKPFLVRSVDIESDKTILLNLNDSTIEKLNISTFYFSNDVPYCKVKENLFEARFSRPALYQISKSMKIVDGNYFINDTLVNHI